MLKKSVAIACFALPFMAMAENGPQWNSVGIAYAEQKPEGVGQHLTGYEVFGSFLVNDAVFIEGRGGDVSKTIASVKNTADSFEVLAGYIMPANETTDFYAKLGYRWSDTSYAGVSAENNDLTFGLGVRSMITPAFELNAALGSFDNEAELSLGAAYQFTPQWAMVGEYKTSDNLDRWLLGVRLNF